MFSDRLPPNAVPNTLSRRLEEMRAAGIRYIDLTESNPTRAALEYPDDLLVPMAASEALRYDPQPFGLAEAREAVAADAARRGARIDPADVVLTASTSEAYAWVFKLLCNPGDRVLVPRPSYPLFEHLTRLEAVRAEPYALDYHGRWEIDIDSVERAAARGARALLVVSPNNPTGSYVKRGELDRLVAVCRRRGLALVIDEVFADYDLDGAPDRVTDVAARVDVLAFTLSGLSKSVGLPQLKLGWLVVGGNVDVKNSALHALELIADSYLSVSTPVQLAASRLLARGADVRRQIHDRVRHNLQQLRAAVERHPACEVLHVEGGWYAVARVPATRSEDELVLGLLERERVLVHPGYFFDFAGEAYIVLSLLPPVDAFAEAVARLLHTVTAFV